MKTNCVDGSWGTLTFDSVTGEVLKYDDEGQLGELFEKGYSEIICIDVAEFLKHYDRTSMSDADILDVGYWYRRKSGVVGYEEPVHEWRNEYRQVS